MTPPGGIPDCPNSPSCRRRALTGRATAYAGTGRPPRPGRRRARRPPAAAAASRPRVAGSGATSATALLNVPDTPDVVASASASTYLAGSTVPTLNVCDVPGASVTDD